MRIIVIRHEKVDMTWDSKYNSAAYDLACERYDRCPLAFPDKKYAKIAGAGKVYVSGLSRTYETACRLFDGTDFVKTPLLNEVPLRSFKDTERSYPLWVWNFIGRFQWFLGKSREPGEDKNSCKGNDQVVGETSGGLLSCHAWVLYEGAY